MDADIRFDDDRITLQARDLDLRDGNQPQGTGADARRVALRHAATDRLVINPDGSYKSGVAIRAPHPKSAIELDGAVQASQDLTVEGATTLHSQVVANDMLRCNSSAEFGGPVVAQDMMVVLQQFLLHRPNGWPSAPELAKRDSDGTLQYSVDTFEVFGELARLRRQAILLEQALRGVAKYVDQAIGVSYATQEVEVVMTKEMSAAEWAAKQGLSENVGFLPDDPPPKPTSGVGAEGKYEVPYIVPPKSGIIP